MRDIPNSALILGLAGLVPFFWGVATSYDPVLYNLRLTWLSERYTGSFISLIVGFLGVFAIDVRFYYWQLTPEWWLPLRGILTFFVVVCLSINFWW